MEDGIGGVELGLRGVHAGLGGQHLQISAAHRQSDEVARILQAVLAGAGGGLGGAVVIERGQVRHGLAEAGLEGEVVERTHDGGNAEAGHADAQSERGEIGLLHGFAEIAVDVRQQGAAGHRHLRAGLTHGLRQPDRAQVVGQAALQRLLERQLAGKRHGRGAARAAAVGSGNLHAGVQGVDAGGGPRHGLFGGADRAALVVAARSRQNDCGRAPPDDRRRTKTARRRCPRPPGGSKAQCCRMVSWHLSSFRNRYQFAHGGHQLALMGRGKHRQLPRLGALGAWQRPGEQAVAGLGALHPLHAAVARVALPAQPAAALQAVEHRHQGTGVEAAQVGNLMLRDVAGAGDGQQPELSRAQPQRRQGAIQTPARLQPDLPVAKPQSGRSRLPCGHDLGCGRLGGGARHGYKVRRNSSVAPANTTAEVNTSAKISLVIAVMPTSLSSSVRKPWTA